MSPKTTTIKKLIKGLASCILCVTLLQTAFFIWIWNSAAPIHKADLIVVFPGDEERIVEGHALARAGYADNLLIVGQTKKSIPNLVKQFGALPAVNLIANGTSRSTFEDVNIARKIIREEGFRSVVLVTSSYHMPRALLLFKTFMLDDTELKVELQYHPVEPGILRDHSRKVRIYCNEMIKLWGSAAEMAGCRITDSLLRDSPFFAKVGQFAKNRLLFKV